LSNQEYFTHKKIIDELKAMKIEYKIVGDYSIVASITKGKSKKKIAFRCEMDALAIEEDSDYKYQSKVNGVAHMCGHDAHMAIMLSVLKILKDIPFNGTLKVIFEEANESYNGAPRIVDSKVLNDVDFIFALHNMPNVKSGNIAICPGIQLIGSDQINIELNGIPAHSSAPTQSSDVILAAASFINNIQSTISKGVHPQALAYATITKFSGGSATNITASKAELNLNLRFVKEEIRISVHNIIKDYLKTIESQFNISSTFNVYAHQDASINDIEICENIELSLTKLSEYINQIESPMQIVSDSFSHYLKVTKGVIGWFGAGYKNEKIYSNHTPYFMIDEDSMKTATALYLQVVYDNL
ncbi:MAG: amidohydrolase, partial [Erysipelotrichales bacterium]